MKLRISPLISETQKLVPSSHAKFRKAHGAQKTFHSPEKICIRGKQSKEV